MPVNWTIAGETGKAFNATARSLESAGIDSARLEFKSLDADTLTFTIAPQSLTSATIPELRQEMILYRNGVQFFVGHVTDIRTMINSGSQQVQVTVSGPWWWLERIPFTSVIEDGTGATKERISYVFGTASAGKNLKTNIQDAINRSAELGAPIATIAEGSSVDGMFLVPRITLNQSTCGQVISELVRICPDTMVWFDYSTKPVRIRVERRGSCPSITFDANTSPITSIDINPIIDLEVSQVVLPYVNRDFKGATSFQVQTAGSNVATKRQVITISGPELDTFLPNNLFDFVLVRKTNIRDYIGNRSGKYRSFIDQYGFNPIGGAWPSGITASSINFWSNNQGFTITNYNIPSANVPSGYYYLFGTDGTQNMPDWVVNDYDVKNSNITGGIWGSFVYGSNETYKSQRSQDFFALFGSNWWTNGSSVYAGSPIQDSLSVDYSQIDFSSNFVNPVFKLESRTGVSRNNTYSTFKLTSDAPDMDLTGLSISWVYKWLGSNYTRTQKISNYNRTTRSFSVYIGEYSEVLPSVGTVFQTDAVKLLYRKADYSFIFPPADLASNLLAAQNWIPYEGSIQIEEEDVGGTRYRGKKIYINNSQSEFSTMGALVSSEKIELETGRTTINLGAPARNDYRTLVDKIRKTSQDNIVYI